MWTKPITSTPVSYTHLLPEVDGVLGTGSYTEIVSALEEVMAGGRPFRFGDIDHTQEDGARLVSTPPYTAYLTVSYTHLYVC